MNTIIFSGSLAPLKLVNEYEKQMENCENGLGVVCIATYGNCSCNGSPTNGRCESNFAERSNS